MYDKGLEGLMGQAMAMGTTAGGLVWALVGFENGIFVEADIIFISMILVLGIRACVTEFNVVP